jgi:citrate lyase beta subunit
MIEPISPLPADFAMATQPLQLGATLYVPATRPDLMAIATGRRWPDLRSVVFCLEDAVLPAAVPAALANLAALLAGLVDPGNTCDAVGAARPLLFARPRDPAMLAAISALPGVEALAGFVVPKATTATFPNWLAQLRHDHHVLMPTLETREAFDPDAVRHLRDQLLTVRQRICVVRIGGNDLMQILGIRQSRLGTAYDGPLGPLIAQLVGQFLPWGLPMSAPVFDAFGDIARLQAEVARDLDHGLATKTAIHPDQIEPIQQAYRVDPDEHEEALAILAPDCPAVFAQLGRMNEPATHRAWARSIVARAAAFGLCERPQRPLALVG